MKHLTILLGTLMLTLSSVAMAQEDDMYFTSRKEKKETAPKAEKTTHKVEIVYETEEPVHAPVSGVVATSELRDVDEYNRRGRRYSSTSADTLYADAQEADTRQAQTYELSAQSLYDLGYSEGYSRDTPTVTTWISIMAFVWRVSMDVISTTPGIGALYPMCTTPGIGTLGITTPGIVPIITVDGILWDGA